MEKEKSTFQKTVEAHGAVEAAEKRIAETLTALNEAQDVYEDAVSWFGNLMLEGEKEDTLELRQEAFKTHEAVLLKELEGALAVKDFTRVAILGNKLVAVEETQKGIFGALETNKPEELVETVKDFLKKHHVANEGDQRHYENRAWILYSSVFAAVRDFDERLVYVEIALEREFADAEKLKPHAALGWADRPKRP